MDGFALEGPVYVRIVPSFTTLNAAMVWLDTY